MSFDWQAIAAPIIVFAAIAYLAWTFVGNQFRKSKRGTSGGCGSCGSCSGGSEARTSEPQLVQIDGMLGKK